MTCIRKEDIAKVKVDLKTRNKSLGQLHSVYKTTEERLNYLEKFFNNRDEAVFFNNKYERYLLKKQKANLKKWLNKTGNILDFLRILNEVKY